MNPSFPKRNQGKSTGRSYATEVDAQDLRSWDLKPVHRLPFPYTWHRLPSSKPIRAIRLCGARVGVHLCMISTLRLGIVGRQVCLTFLLPPVRVTLTKRRVYVSLFLARPLGVLAFSCFSTCCYSSQSSVFPGQLLLDTHEYLVVVVMVVVTMVNMESVREWKLPLSVANDRGTAGSKSNSSTPSPKYTIRRPRSRFHRYNPDTHGLEAIRGLVLSYLRGLRLDLTVTIISVYDQRQGILFEKCDLPSTGERSVYLTHVDGCGITWRLMKSCRLVERCDVKVIANGRGWRMTDLVQGKWNSSRSRLIFDAGKAKCGIVGVESYLGA